MSRHRRSQTASERAVDYVYELGMQVPDRPDDEDFPELPEDLTVLSEQELMRQFRRFVAWQNYAATQVAMLEVDEEFRTASTREEEAVAYLEKSDEILKRDLRSHAPVGTLIKAERDADESVRRERHAQQVIYAKRKLVQSIHDSLERSAKLISRELTRRTEVSAVDRRDARLTGA